MNKQHYQKLEEKIKEAVGRKEIEERAANLAYSAGLGASEWEAFLDRVNLTLEDVLVAIIKNSPPYPKELIYNVYIKKLIKMWVFNKPLSEQREETLTFLYNLICKK